MSVSIHLKSSFFVFAFIAILSVPVALAQSKAVQLPIYFEPNRGQAVADVRYLLRDGSLSGEFFRDGVSLALPLRNQEASHVRMQLLDVSQTTAIEGQDALDGHTNYLLGNDPSHWLRAVPNYAKIRYRGIYPRIDLVFYGNGHALEHDFELQPGADPHRIAFRIDGARKLTLNSDGSMRVAIAGGEIRFTRPVAYQMAGNNRQPVDARFLLHHDGTVRIRLGRFDATRALVIDPALDYATYLDTMSDVVSAVATDAAGDTYITGMTFNSTYPVTPNAFQTKCPACSYNTAEVFVTKLNSGGTAQVYSTFLAGSNYSQPSGIALDANGNAIVTGMTEATDFPVKNPVSSITNNVGDRYAFITSLSADGSSLNYSSVMGGGMTSSSAVAIDSLGAAYITGTTDSSAFPLTSGALKTITPAYPEYAVFVSKFTVAGALSYSAIIGDATPQTGGGGYTGSSSIAVDSQGSAYVAGGAGSLWPVTAGTYAGQPATPIYRSVFVTKLTPDGSALAYSTLVGPGYVNSLTLDANNNVYIAGEYDSTSFPVTAGAYQTAASSCCMYFGEVNPTGTQLLYSSFFGGKTSFGVNTLDEIRLDNKGNIWLSGATEDSSFPLVNPLVGQLPPAVLGTSSTSFLSEFDSTGTKLEFSTFIGDQGNSGVQIALDAMGKVHAAGVTASDAFYTTPSAFIGSVAAPPQGYEYNYPYAELIDPAASAATVCLPNGESYGIGFGYLIPGASSTQTITIQSCGSAALNITSITANNAAFTVPAGSNNCTGSIAAGSSCTVSVAFAPSSAQSYSGTLTITSNATVATTSIPLSGVGANPVAAFGRGGAYPIPVFQPVLVGQTSSTALVQFYNNGPVPLTINLSQTTISGDFALASGGNCAASLAANGECFFAVTFSPTAAGTRTGFLSVASNDPVNPVVSATLTATAYSTYPTPTITALLSPSFAINGSTSPVTVSVEGAGFFPASVVYLNGVAQTTTYYSSGGVSFSLNPSALTAVGAIPVTVQNPSSGGASAPYPLIAYLAVPITASALTVDPVGGLLYAAVPSAAATNPNTVIPITPSTGAMGTPIAVAAGPRALAVSSDGTELYVASTGVLQRFNLKTLALERSFALPVDPMWGQTYVHEMHVVPGSPQSIVVELFANVDPAEDGAALYNDSGLVNWAPGVGSHGPQTISIDSFAFTTASMIYAVPGPVEIQVNSSGLSRIGLTSAWTPQMNGGIIRSDGTLLYTNDGQVWNPSTQQLLGTYLETLTGYPMDNAASVIPEAASGHTYFLDLYGQYAGYQAVNIDTYGQANFGFIGSVPFTSIYPPDAVDLVRWGSNGFAFRCVDITGSQSSANQIVIVTSSLVTGASSAPAAPIISTVSPTTVYSGGAAFTLQVNGSGFTSTSTIVVNGTALTTSYTSSSSLSAQVPASYLYEWGQLNVQVVNSAAAGGTSNYATVGISPAIALTPSSLGFGNLAINTSSTAQSAYVYNETANPLSITSIAASAGYTETNNCGSSLAANSSCTINVVLDPTSTGMIAGTLTVTDGAPGSTQTVSLLGYGLAPYSVGAGSGGSLSATTASGGTATYNLQLSGRTGFSGSVSLSCSGAPQYATCSVSPSSLTLTSGGSGTFTVTVSTEITTAAAVAKPSRLELAGFGLFALLLLPMVRFRKRSMRLWLGGVILAAVCLGSGLTACGGGSGGGGGSVPVTQTYKTAPGTYTLTLTTSSSSVTSSQALILVVN